MENSLEKIFEEVDSMDIHSNNVCMSCGAILPDEYTTHCEICGYDSSEAFDCPYQVSSSVKLDSGNQKELVFCKLTKKQCQIKGLDFEICSVLRSLDFINKSGE